MAVSLILATGAAPSAVDNPRRGDLLQRGPPRQPAVAPTTLPLPGTAAVVVAGPTDALRGSTPGAAASAAAIVGKPGVGAREGAGVEVTVAEAARRVRGVRSGRAAHMVSGVQRTKKHGRAMEKKKTGLGVEEGDSRGGRCWWAVLMGRRKRRGGEER